MFSDKTIENKHMHTYKHTFPKCPLEGRAIVNTWLHHFMAVVPSLTKSSFSTIKGGCQYIFQRIFVKIN